MYKENFDKISDQIKSHPTRLAAFKFVYTVFPMLNIAAYPMLLVYLFVTGDERLLRCIAVPLFMFVTLSAGRHILNLERPYEKYDITPIIPKNKKGRSFPSRHTASAAIIGVTFLYISVPLGVLFLVIAAFVGISRAVGGVHFPRDVIAGFVYALICGAAYFF